MKKIILSLLCLSVFTVVQAQNDYSKQLNDVKNSYDQDKLTELSNEYSEKYTRLKNEAEAYALLNNIPLKKDLQDGGYAELQYISEDGIPIYFRTFNVDAATSTRADYLNTGGGLGLDLNGNGLTAHVWDGGHARESHQEYDGTGGNNRVTIMDAAAEGGLDLNFHAGHVTGTICASGFQPSAKGMAWQCDVNGYKWNDDLAEATTAANNGMLVSNHSYGYIASSIPDDWFGQYWTDARDWDDLMYNAPYYLMMVAAGNDGTDNTSNAFPLDGNSSYDKLSGHATAKNNLVIANGQDASINGDGSLNSMTINSGSSEGPTDDYRIKPDLTGNGTGVYSTYASSDNVYASISGTSMASPNVTGTLLLLQEHYNNLNGSFMRASTLKGIALHTADDAGPAGPDAVYGWGLLNAKKGAETLTTAAAGSGSAIVSELNLSQGQTYQITVQSNGVDPLMASISWTDPAGALNGGTNSNTPALINDLDIRLDNGTTFTPWRLTGVTTNGTGDNIVDPFERIDVNGASGTYTLTVTHKGTLSSGSQDYSLIVTGIVVASTPVISFSSTSGNTNENTDCSFTDIDVILNIGQAPSDDALVTFSVNGASTATPLLDFEVLTPTVTFLNGVTTSQTMTVRVYHDGFVEANETAIIDFIVTTVGDATADTNADTFTLIINDDDVAPVSSFTVDLVNEDFETAPAGWLNGDRDGDTFAWLIGAVGAAHLSTNQLFSRSWDSTNGALTPDNYIITSQITIPASLISLNLSYQVSPSTLTNSWFEEYYTVYWTTDISSYATIDAGAQVKPGAIIAQAVVNENIDMSAYIGQTGYLVFRHHNCTDEEYIAIDNLLLQGTSNTNVQTTVNTGVSNDSQQLASAGTIYTNDSVSGNLMVDITNNQADDYGCVDISVSRAGTGAQSYNGSVAPNLAMDKVFTMSQSNGVPAGDTSIKFYFTEAEIAGWEAVTGEVRANLLVGREVGGTITEISTLTLGTFGTNVTFIGNFTGLDGDFYFGAAGVVAVGTCGGGTNTWNGSSWTLDVPNNTQNVVVNSSYNTNTNGGSIDACTLFIDPSVTLTVTAGNYVKVEGNITVDNNATLTIEHEGSLVQVDDNATVTNNGTINIIKTTPVATGNSFSILGSPMSGTTRGGAFVDNNVVMYHQTAQFNLDPDVTAVNAGAEHFADVEGDNWQFISNGTTNVFAAEGYLLGPTTQGVIDGFYDITYNEGTLNNGIYTKNVIYNLVGTAAENKSNSPNILSNPYASAIDADALITNNAVIDELYFWEHLIAPSAGYPGYRFENWNMGDISIRNMGGSVQAPNGGAVPTQFIASGQGFGIKANAAGTVTFNNVLRVTGNNTGYRNSEIERMYLKISNETYALKSSTLVAFTNGATNGYEAMYDTKRLATPISIYSLLEERELAIQGRSVFTTDQVIPLGFRTMVEEVQTYTISLGTIEGANITEATVYLQDNLLGTVTNLTEGSYTFTSNESNQKDRFVIVFTEEQLGNNDVSLEAISLYPNPTATIFNIVSPLSTINKVEVYDVQGRVIASIAISDKSTYQLDMSTYNTAMYFVKVTTNDGDITKRVVKK